MAVEFAGTGMIGSAALKRDLHLAIGSIAVLVSLALSGACASGPRRPPTGTPEPDKFLFERGTEALNERKWLTAREYYRQLVDEYPQSPYRAHASADQAPNPSRPAPAAAAP